MLDEKEPYDEEDKELIEDLKDYLNE